MKFCGIMFCFLVLSIQACTVKSLPPLPVVSTQNGRDCLKECQREHRHCTGACQGMLLEEKVCLSQCNQVLEDCYRLCREDDASLNEPFSY